MEITQLVERTPFWLSAEGEKPELVLSTRARIARNLMKYPFDRRMNDERRLALLSEVKEAIQATSLRNLTLFDVSSLPELDKSFLVERHLISLDLLRPGKGRAVFVDEEERISIMVNEEDHLRIQVLLPGLNLEQSWKVIEKIDEELGNLLDYAYKESYGFLTSCPTNLGTGLRFSVLLHLPGIVLTNQVEELFKSLRKARVYVRGLYGEGSEIQGNIFQLSTQLSLGFSEEELLKNFQEVVQAVLDFERKARAVLVESMRDVIEDKIYRALAILQAARLLTFREVAEYSSMVRLGIGLGLFFEPKIRTLNELLLYSQPAHLQKLFGAEMGPRERDAKRAAYVKTKLKTG